MRAWTNGERHVVVTPRGTLVTASGRTRVLDKPVAVNEHANDEVLAVTPSGRFAWTADLARLDLDRGTLDAPRLEAPALDVVALDEERVAAVIATGKGPELRVGRARSANGAEALAWETTVLLVVKSPPRAAFPKVIWSDEAKLPYPRTTAFAPKTTVARPVRLGANAHGIAVSGHLTGLVGVLRPGGRSLEFAYRIPSQDEARIHAVPTAEGVLVTVVVSGREGAVMHFAKDGSCLAHSPTTYWSVPALLTRGAAPRVLVFDDRTTDKHLRAFDLDGFSERAKPVVLGEAISDAAIDAAGATAIFVGESNVHLVRVGDDGTPAPAETTSWRDLLKERAIATHAAERAATKTKEAKRFTMLDGPASIGFAAIKRPSDAWTVAAGAKAEIPLFVRSTGSAGKGLTIAVSGPAIEQGLVRAVAIEAGGARASFDGTTAQMPAFAIPRGMAFPFDPKPNSPEVAEEAQAQLAETHLTIALTIEGVRAGSALLAVAIGAVGGAVPMKWTRPITVQ